MNKLALWLLRHGGVVIVVADNVAELGRLIYRAVLDDPFQSRRRPWWYDSRKKNDKRRNYR